MDKKLIDRGEQIRREVLGAEYMDKVNANVDDFNRPFQEFVAEYCWNTMWGDETLPRKTRSMLNLAMLMMANRQHELRLHIRAALRNGVTREEMRAIFMHVSVYAGVPAGVEAFRAAREVFAEDKSA